MTNLHKLWPLLLACCAVATVAPASAQAFQKGFWGPTEIDGVSQFPLYKKLRVTLFQTTLSWAAVAPTRPADPRDSRDAAYRWPPELDSTITEARSHGMSVLLMLIGTPPWANGGRSAEYAPDRPRDFASFARAAARRYPSVKHWMIWGEPSRSKTGSRSSISRSVRR